MDERLIPEASDRTLTLCPECWKVVDAWLYESGSDIFMRTFCPKHGQFDQLYYKDSSLYRAVDRIVDKRSFCRKMDCARKIACHNHLEKTYNIMIDLTQRCNMRCPVCFAEAEDAPPLNEPTALEIYERLPKQRVTNRPNVVFIGGEPTLRKDLPDLIRGVLELGYIPRVSTNGIKLLDIEYCRKLHDAGLRWIILQFDGLSDEVFLQLRGRPFLEDKKKIIANCRETGIAVQLAVMVDEKRNGDQVGAIIDYGFSEPAIKWINFYPHTIVNREELADGAQLHVVDMLRIIEEQTGGAVTRQDYLRMMAVLAGGYKLTGHEIMRQKISTYPMVLIKSAEGMVPLPRLLDFSGALQHGSALKTLVAGLPRMLNFQKMEMPDNVLFITMEKFHNRFAIDLCEAGCCHMAFMVRDGFVPFDIYNCLYRESPNW